MTDYLLIQQFSVDDLENAVNKAISKGYSIKGGVSITYNSDRGQIIYCQAVIKKIDIDKLIQSKIEKYIDKEK